jgi:hypothetical protein
MSRDHLLPHDALNHIQFGSNPALQAGTKCQILTTREPFTDKFAVHRLPMRWQRSRPPLCQWMFQKNGINSKHTRLHYTQCLLGFEFADIFVRG